MGYDGFWFVCIYPDMDNIHWIYGICTGKYILHTYGIYALFLNNMFYYRYLHIFCNCIGADMDMTEWEKMHFPWIYFTTKNARELMPPMHHFDGSCQFILHHTLFGWSLRPNVQLFSFSLLHIFVPCATRKVFMRYLRCHIFNIKMPSCLVLSKEWGSYAKL